MLDQMLAKKNNNNSTPTQNSSHSTNALHSINELQSINPPVTITLDSIAPNTKYTYRALTNVCLIFYFAEEPIIIVVLYIEP